MRVVSVACGSPVVRQQGVNVVMPGGAEAGDYGDPHTLAKDISAEDIGHWLPARAHPKSPQTTFACQDSLHPAFF